MKKILFFALFLSVSIKALAGSSNISGQVSGYIVSSSGANELFIFKLNNSVPNGCNKDGRFAIDSTSPHFKSVQSAVLASYHSQSNMKVYFQSNECTALSNSEDVLWTCIGDIPC